MSTQQDKITPEKGDEMNDAARVAKEIRDELGNWTLGEIGDIGLVDQIWSTHLPFQDMSADEREAFATEVYAALFDGPEGFEFPAVYRDYGRDDEGTSL